MSSAPRHTLHPGIHWLRPAIVPAVVFITCCLDRGYQTDFWHHLARGKAIVESGTIVDVESFTCTLGGTPTRDANWLAQVLFFRLHAWGGLSLVQAVNALILAATLAIVFRLCRRSGASGLHCGAVTAFTFLGLWQTFLIRPQSLSLLLFVLLYHVLRYGSARRRLIACPLLLAVWCNLHGGFPIGLALIVAFAAAEFWQEWKRRSVSATDRGLESAAKFSFRAATVRERCSQSHAHRSLTVAAQKCGGANELNRAARRSWRHDSAVFIRSARAFLPLVLSLLATFINPYGWTIYRYVGSLTARAAERGIEEWLPPGLHQWIGVVFFGSLLLLIIAYAAVRRWPRAIEWCTFLLFLPLAFRSVRMTAWWFLVIAPILATVLSERYPESAKSSRPRGAVPALGACVLLAVLCLFSLPCLERYNPLFGPVRDAHRVEDDLHVIASTNLAGGGNQGRVLSRLEWGDYLDAALGPSRRVFMDGRIEIYPDSLWQEYESVTSGQANWQQILDDHAVDFLLLDRTYHQGLLARVERSPDWKRQTARGNAILYRRRPLSGVARGD